ncbi:MAG: GHKL domain-containing protein [Lachnospiraceae bacterium]|nr:GHKL domain-containing protein [Lachnospiraceae bacterium]
MDWSESILTVFSLLVNLLTVLNIWLLLKVFFGCDLKLTEKSMLVSAGCFLIFNVGICFLFYSYENLQVLLIYLFILLGTFCLAREKRWKSLLFSLPAILLYIAYTLSAEMLDVLFGLEKFGIVAESGSISPCYMIADLVLFILLLIVLRKSERQKWSLTLTIGEGIGVIVYSLFFIALKYIFEIYAELGISPFHRLFGYVFLLALNLGFLYAIIHRKLAGYYKNVSQNYKEQFEEEYSYFQDYKDKQQDTAQFRHDWQNHMLVLQKMLRDGDYTRAEEYFEGLSGVSGVTTQKILTGNEMLDMLLCIKERECREKNIAVSMEGTLSELNRLKPVDSSILFSNLLDNAIEANRKVESDRFIKIRARRVNEAIYFEMENPMEEELQYEGSRLLTTKEDSEAHGLGLKNVAEIVKKYQGKYHLEGKKKRFTIQIIFPSAG